MTEKGKLYLIPSPLGEYPVERVLPSSVLQVISHIRNYVVEETRTARRFLSSAGLKGQIGELSFVELNEHTGQAEIEAMLQLFDAGDVGLISEAGLPAVADPGSALVALCHKHGIKVVPMVGPSSLMLALMASGMNGQRFAFCGYLPAKIDERRSAIRAVEKRSKELKESEIIIETPYRNDSFFADLLSCCMSSTRICIAANITCDDEFVSTRTVAEWKKNVPQIGKRPCVFILLA